jgi:hypothetical protein
LRNTFGTFNRASGHHVAFAALPAIMAPHTLLPTEAPDPRRTSWLMAILLALAAVSIGYAIHIRVRRVFDPRWDTTPSSRFHWVAAGIALTLRRLLSRGAASRTGATALLIALGVGLAFQ